ncbi:MAG: OmpA family protein [Micropruina sp.]|uniref:OmpA family protein n=1 Tax=Micropruina sp. TaxID=2737536 RepID=UPI0039E489FB
MPRPLIAAVAGAVLLTGCSVSVSSGEPSPSAPATTTAPEITTAAPSPSSTGTVAADAVPGYQPGQFPPVPLFSLPDVSRLSTAGKSLRDKLQPTLKSIPGVKITAVRCTKDGEYSNADSGLVLYGDGSGSYVGPDGSYSRGRDGSETSVSDRESITRDGKGGGTYVSSDVSITNSGDGSGTYVDADLSVTIDGKGGGTYVSKTESITNSGDGSGTYVSGKVSITNDGNGSGTYVDGQVSIANDGNGTANVVGPTFSGDVPADPLPPVPPLGKFPPVVQLLPKVNICGFVITLADGVLFDFDKDNIRADAADTLDRVSQALGKVGNSQIRISGHTDAIGTDSYNQGLSERRAASVEQALRQRGVSAPMTAKGYGEAKPVAPNQLNGKDNPAGRQLNRRVEIFVRT